MADDKAVASHETALELLDLSDVIPNAIHFTVPRSIRHLPDLVEVKIHTTTYPLAPLDILIREGIRATSAARTILDVAASGIAPEQVELAVRQSIQRGLATRGQLEHGARLRSARVSELIRGAVQMEIP